MFSAAAGPIARVRAEMGNEPTVRWPLRWLACCSTCYFAFGLHPFRLVPETPLHS
jgi:hypothetical protein